MQPTLHIQLRASSRAQARVLQVVPSSVDFPKANAELVKTNLFEYLDFALQFAPILPREVRIALSEFDHYG